MWHEVKLTSKMLCSGWLVTICFFLMAKDAHAYIDPGAGSLLLQMLAAAFFGALFTIKIYWNKIKNYFKKSNSGPEEQKGSDFLEK